MSTLPFFSDISYAMSDLSFVNTITLVSIVILATTTALRPNASQYSNINNFGQDMVEFFQSNVVTKIVEFAPLLIFVMYRGRVPGYYFLLNAVILYALSYLFRLSISTYLENKYDDFDQNVGFVNANNEGNYDATWSKLTAFRWNASKVLRGSAFSCVAVGLLTIILDRSLM